MFLDLIFPERIGRNSTISSTFDTYIEQNGFFEKRNSRYSFSRITADLSFHTRRKTEILELKDLHEKARGSGFSFKFRDFTYNTTNQMIQKPTPVDFKIANSFSEFEVMKRLQDKNGKIVQLPENESIYFTYNDLTSNTIEVITDVSNNQDNIDYITTSVLNFFSSSYENNINIFFTQDILDYSNGKYKQDFIDIIEQANINEDVGIYVGFKFFLKVRFESDSFSVVANGYDSYEAPDCRLIEVFEWGI